MKLHPIVFGLPLVFSVVVIYTTAEKKAPPPREPTFEELKVMIVVLEEKLSDTEFRTNELEFERHSRDVVLGKVKKDPFFANKPLPRPFHEMSEGVIAHFNMECSPSAENAAAVSPILSYHIRIVMEKTLFMRGLWTRDGKNGKVWMEVSGSPRFRFDLMKVPVISGTPSISTWEATLTRENGVFRVHDVKPL